MSREVRRVALDFEWPIHKVWEGYLMPESLHSLPCPNEECCNGQTPAAAWVMDIASLLLMLDDDLDSQARGRDMHPYFHSLPHHGYQPRPSADIREFGTGLAGRESSFFGHDAIDRWRAFDRLRKAAGLGKKWGRCPTCKGRAYVDAYDGQKADIDAWKPTEPPTGEGWQIWETVSEGSPVTPVYATAEALAAYLTEHPGILGPSSGTGLSFDAALAWVNGPGWIPSGVGSAAGYSSGSDLLGSAS